MRHPPVAIAGRWWCLDDYGRAGWMDCQVDWDEGIDHGHATKSEALAHTRILRTERETGIHPSPPK